MATTPKFKYKIVSEIKIKAANLDKHTIKYIEYIAQAKGQAALDKYLSFVCWKDWGAVGKPAIQLPLEHRLDHARKMAVITNWRQR
jgi:hypothetical protein